MAEAIVDGTSSMTRFFCHRCSVEIEHLLPDYTCPRCSTGFIEELERRTDNGSAMDTDNQDLSDNEVDVTSFNDFSDSFDLPMDLIRAAVEASRVPGSRNSGFRNNSHLPVTVSDVEPVSSNTFYNTRSQQQHQQQQQQQQPQQLQQQQQIGLPPHIDNIIQDLFFNLSGIGFSFPQGQGGQAPIFDIRLFLGNPGDYVWGQSGLDSIVTQLLNQMDGTGPPPLSKNQIDEIPTTTVSQTQIDSKLQCSVCWEDFILEEPVRQLPCQHYFHAPCIVPWLELHGTCPICRQSLGDQTTVDANQDTVGPSIAALFRAANESTSTRTSSASLESSSANDSPNRT